MRYLAAVLLAVCLAVPAIPDPETSPRMTVQEFIRAVTVQVLVNLEKYTRSLTWYQEVAADGTKSDWKVKYGDWSPTPTPITIAGTGIIIFSGQLPIGADGCVGATYILTNYHVIEPLVRREALGSRLKPIDVYDEKDLIITEMPPSVTPRPGARPVAQSYFVLPKDYIIIKHKEDQTYEVRAEIVACDASLDVALLRLKNVWGLPYVNFRDIQVKVGEEVWICHAPLALPFSIDKGRVNQINLNLGKSGYIVWDKQVKLDIACAPGSSGSGIFDTNGYLVAELHGVLVYNYNYIRGGSLAIDGMLIREWLIWNGYSFIVFNTPYPLAPYAK